MPQPESVPELSILIVNYNTRDHLIRCLASLRTFPPEASYEIVIVDNGSVDGSLESVQQEFSECITIRTGSNEGYGVALNRAARWARGRWLLFLNPDTEVTERAIETLLEFGRRQPTAGVIGPRLLFPDGSTQTSAWRFPSTALVLLESFRLHLLLPRKLRARLLLGAYFESDSTCNVPWISGACHLIPRDVWDTVGPLTEETFCGYDDFDYCYRTAKFGYQVWLCTEASIIHHGGAARRQRWSPPAMEELNAHSLYVVLGAHWPLWRVRVYCFAECICWVLELFRISLVRRPGMDSISYALLVKKRLRLPYSILSGQQFPIRRFEPTARIQ